MKRSPVIFIFASFTLLVMLVVWWFFAPKPVPAEVNHVSNGMVAGEIAKAAETKPVAVGKPVVNTRSSETRIDVQIPKQITGQGGGERRSATAKGGAKNTSQTRYQAYQAVSRAVQEGRRLPVALMDGHQSVRLTAQQRTVLESVEQEFLDTLQSAMENAVENSAQQNNAMQEEGGSEVPASVWEQARGRADNRFRLLFGNDAFNRLTISTAVDVTAN